MIRAAGVLFRAGEKVLFVRRTAEGDAVGMWAFPGGKVEEGEAPADAAAREVKEETGHTIKGELAEITRRIKDGVDFTTYVCDEYFVPTLNTEHDAFIWATPEAAPTPLHPGCAIALQKIGPNWDELSIAKAISTGDLVSPQFYENLALFDIRITGTGKSYRSEKRDEKGKIIQEAEVVWRDPSIYLNDEFLARCNGLPTILEHPKGEMLDSEQYRERNVGSVFLPYIKPSPIPGEPDEVWGVSKILDMPAASLMVKHRLSTSPAVVWNDPSVNTEGELGDGRRFFREGKPSLLDHIAICLQGVWDKGGEPTGVSVTRGDSTMTAEELAKFKAEQEKKGADILAAVGGLADSVKGLVSRFDSIAADQAAIKTRFDESMREDAMKACDAFEFSKRKDGEDDKSYKERHDAEESELAKKLEAAGEKKEAAADRRKDAEEDEKKAADADEDDRKDADLPEAFKKNEKKADKKDSDEDREDEDEMESKKDRKDRQDSDRLIRSRQDALESELATLRAAARPKTDEELNDYGRVQSRADTIAVSLGSRARGPMMGESLVAYRRNFMNEFKHLSPTWKDKDLTVVVANDSVMATVEDQILSEALATAESPASIKKGEMRRRTRKDDAGHTIHTYEGEPRAWMDDLAGAGKQAAKAFMSNQGAR